MRQIEFVNPRKEEKKVSEIKSGDMFKTIFDTADLRTHYAVLGGT